MGPDSVAASSMSIASGGAASGHEASASGVAQPADAAAVPTVFRWEHGGNNVYITGTFNGWSRRVPMHRSGNDFIYIQSLPKGKHAFKFIVDDEWRFAPDQPTVSDTAGNINNYIDLTTFDPEHDAIARKGASACPRHAPMRARRSPPHFHAGAARLPSVLPHRACLHRPHINAPPRPPPCRVLPQRAVGPRGA
jgi:hypothetical protein